MKPKPITTTLILLFMSWLSFGQSENKPHEILRQSVLDSLKSNNIKESVTLINFCGCGPKSILDENGKSFSGDDFQGFSIWKDKSQNYIQRFNLLGKSKPQKILDSNILDFAKQNITTIRQEEIRPFQARGEMDIITESGSGFSELYIVNESISLSKTIYEIDLRKSLDADIFGSPKNKNYAGNSKMKIVELYQIFKHIVYPKSMK